MIFNICELGADLNWSTEEKFFELKLLMNFKGAPYDVSQLPRSAKAELTLLTQVLQKLQTGELIQVASENSQDKIEQECCICFEIGAVVLIPCGRHDKEDYIYHHQEKICTSCLKKLSQCPLCRRVFERK